MKKKTEKTNSHSEKQLQELAELVQQDFLERCEQRKPFEAQWQLNLNFLLGNQYCSIAPNNEVQDFDKQYFWQEREVYNHIAPILEARMSKLVRVQPSMTVVPASNDEKDVYTAKVSKKIIQAVKHKLNLTQLTNNATLWSEIAGTVFYKVMWNEKTGEIIGENQNGEPIYEGDVEVCICPPYEIYPDNLSAGNIDECKSIIHAKAYDVKDIELNWGIKVQGKDIDVFSLDSVSSVGGFGYSSKVNRITAKTKKDNAVVIEKYEMPSKEFPNGRLIIVCENQVLYIGELPYINKQENLRGFPFIQQNALKVSGNFWGSSVIERCIPIQRAYNAIKNRKHEYLNRLSMGVVTVEDGSVDIDNLIEEGISPGKVLVYRQGSNPPSLMATGKVPSDFASEEDRLLQEFILLSGVSDLMRSSSAISNNVSGVALQLLIEQDESKLTQTAENIRMAQKEMASQILRLYKQFSVGKRTAKIVGAEGGVDMFYFSTADISSDDIIFETENEMNETVSQKRSMVFELLNAGLLHDENGKLSNSMRLKVLELLGFGMWEGSQDLTSLHTKKADTENIEMIKMNNCEVWEIDDHNVHINQHIAYMLSNEFEKKVKLNPQLKQIFLNHIQQHKMLNEQNLNKKEL